MSGISKRFCHILDLESDSSKSYILATTSLPKFKLKWLTDNEKFKSVKLLFLLEMKKMHKSMNKNISGDTIMDTDEDDFFYIKK